MGEPDYLHWQAQLTPAGRTRLPQFQVLVLSYEIPPPDHSLPHVLGYHHACTFPIDPTIRCPYGSQIDQPGYHLLSNCGHGPWRMKRHNTLHDALFQALLLNNPEVVREQRLSGSTKERPGGVFTPVL